MQLDVCSTLCFPDIHFDRGEYLPYFVVKFASKMSPFGFLCRNQLARKCFQLLATRPQFFVDSFTITDIVEHGQNAFTTIQCQSFERPQ